MCFDGIHRSDIPSPPVPLLTPQPHVLSLSLLFKPLSTVRADCVYGSSGDAPWACSLHGAGIS